VLNIISASLLILSFTFTIFWRNFHNVSIFSQLGEERRLSWESKNQNRSLILTFIGFIYVTLLSPFYGFDLWNILAIIIFFLFLNFWVSSKNKKTLIKGDVYSNNFKNFLAIELPLTIAYLIVWGKLGYIFFTLELF